MPSIPDIIHYCWFGDKKPDRSVTNCIKTWRKHMPHCQIKCWNEQSIDIRSIPFLKEAYEARKFAFIADYVRLYALYTEGGIYFDTDVKLYKPIAGLQSHRLFVPTQRSLLTGHNLMSAIIGSEKGHPFIKLCLDYYDNLHFDKDNYRNFVINPIMSQILHDNYEYEYRDANQQLKDDILVMDSENFGEGMFLHKNRKEYTAIHFCNQSWVDQNRGGGAYNFCKSNDLLSLYNLIEKAIRLLKKA